MKITSANLTSATSNRPSSEQFFCWRTDNGVSRTKNRSAICLPEFPFEFAARKQSLVQSAPRPRRVRLAALTTPTHILRHAVIVPCHGDGAVLQHRDAAQDAARRYRVPGSGIRRQERSYQIRFVSPKNRNQWIFVVILRLLITSTDITSSLQLK